MACFADDETRAAMRVNKDIEREIERWKKDQSKEYKLLLLGEPVCFVSSLVQP